MKRLPRLIAATAAAAALSLGAAPAALAAEAGSPSPAAAPGTSCPAAADFSLTAPSHTEVAGHLLDKQITFGAYWTGGNLPAGTQASLAAGPAEVTLLDGRSFTAPAVAGASISGLFPNGGAAFAPSFRLPDSSRSSAVGPTRPFHVTSISYPVTVTGNFGSCQYTLTGTANSMFNVTSIELNERA